MPRILLQCISGPLTGQVFRLNGGPVFLFGRYPKANFSLAVDPAASHLHFLVDTSENRIRIIDLGSTNGLVVNDKYYGGKTGAPLKDFITLNDGDVVLAGSCMFRLNVSDTRASTRGAAPLDTVKRSITAPQPRNVPPTRYLNQHDGMLDTADAPPGDDGPPTVAPYHPPAFNASPVVQSRELPVVEGFTLVEKIADGGKGMVFKAIKDDTGATAAIKMLLAKHSGKQRSIEVFRREILVTKQLVHPNIIRYIADGVAEGDPYLALEFASGGTLDSYIGNMPSRRMDVPEAVPLFIQILEAVAYMHSKKMVHRDIKPKNVLLDIRRGGSIASKLSDMGLSCLISGPDTEELFPIITDGGTPAYMPPEQLLDVTRAIPASDVFSTSATFYQMLTGALLYDFAGREAKDVIVEGNIKPILYLRPDLPLGLANVISKGLSYNAENRYADAQEMLDVLKQALA